MPGRLGEPPSPPFYSPVSTHGAQAPQGGPAHSAAGTIGTLVLGAVQLREPLWGGRVDADLEQVAAARVVVGVLCLCPRHIQGPGLVVHPGRPIRRKLDLQRAANCSHREREMARNH